MWDDQSPKDLEEKWRAALENLKLSRAKVAARYNAGRPDCPYKVGDLVLCRVFPLSSAVKHLSAKLMRKWIGPLKIAKFTSPVTVNVPCDVQTDAHQRKAHITHLKPYNPR